MARSRSNLVLLFGAVFSVMAHLGFGYLLIALPTPTLTVADPFTPESDNELDLGIERSNTVTITWMGFEEPTEHQARKSEVDQAEMTTDPSGGGAAAADGEVAPEPQMAPPQQVMEPSLPEPAEARPGEQPIEVAIDETPEIPEPSTEIIDDQIDAPTDETTDQAQPADQRASLRQDPQHTTPDPIDQPTDDAETAKSEQPDSERAGDGPDPGQAADRESPATSIEEPLEVKPGRPAAQEGLKVITRRIKWPNLLRLRSRPSNPIVEFYFNREGQVADLRFARDEETKREYNSGSAEVDEVLINNLYGWSAKGAQLEELPEDDEDATLKVVIRILLR